MTDFDAFRQIVSLDEYQWAYVTGRARLRPLLSDVEPEAEFARYFVIDQEHFCVFVEQWGGDNPFAVVAAVFVNNLDLRYIKRLGEQHFQQGLRGSTPVFIHRHIGNEGTLEACAVQDVPFVQESFRKNVSGISGSGRVEEPHGMSFGGAHGHVTMLPENQRELAVPES